MSIIDLMDDPKTFAPHFTGETWDRWRVFLKGMFGLPMDEAEFAVFSHHTGRTTAPTTAFTEASLICGRRGGKSRVLALIATYLATFVDYKPHLAAGEVGTVAVIAADRRQARTILRYIMGLLNAVPMLKKLIETEKDEAVILNNRVAIEIHTASFRVTRGYTLVAALADEVAFWRTDDSANPDVEILGALRPGLSSIPGAVLLKASSPYAKRGVLYSDFRKHYGQDASRMLVWRGTTAEMNPRIDPQIIADAYEADPANAAAEYGAEFRSDIAAFVSREVVDGCTVPGRFELAYVGGTKYVAFVDPSGGSADSMTCAIAHLADDVAVLDCVREVKPPFSPESVVKEFATTLMLYGLTSVTGDRYGGEWPRERFREHGIAYELSDKPKTDIYRDILPALNSGKVELLDIPRLTTQLCSLERRTARGGRDNIDHPPGGHDDIANSVAGALLRLSAGGPMNSAGLFELMRLQAAAVRPEQPEETKPTPAIGSVEWQHNQLERTTA